MTDKVQKIREEVVRLKSNLMYGACSSQIAMETHCKEEAYNEVLAILDAMQEEPVSEDLEEAARRYVTPPCVLGIKTFKAGAKWQREKMMAKALDVEVKEDCGGYPYIPQMELYDYDKDIPLAKDGDKYKVILIKEY